MVVALVLAEIGAATGGAAVASDEGVASTGRCPEPTSGVLHARDVPAGTSVSKCHLERRSIRRGRLTLQIPQTGHVLESFVEYVDGGEGFAVGVTDAGEVVYPDAEPTSVAGGSSSGPDACDAVGQSNRDREQAGTYHWHLGDGTRPAGLSTDKTADILEQAVGWLVNTHNDCGLAQSSSARQQYDGISALESDITVSGGGYQCGDGSDDGHDSENVVDFGNLDNHGNPPLAVTCTWMSWNPYDEDNIDHADIRFDTTDYSWYNSRPEWCSNSYDIRSVAVHEFGHAFGLGHVDETWYGELTMSTDTPACREYQRTLGRGDVYSMWEVY